MIKKSDVVLAALLHDVGNLVKFDFNQKVFNIGDERYWRQQQMKLWKKYGRDDHVVTEAILKELNVKLDIIKWIKEKTFGNIIKLVKNKNKWETKILLYADLRVLPDGIGTIEDRIRDIQTRMPHYYTRPDFELMKRSIFKLQDQIQQQIRIPVTKIKIYEDKLKNFLSIDLG